MYFKPTVLSWENIKILRDKFLWLEIPILQPKEMGWKRQNLLMYYIISINRKWSLGHIIDSLDILERLKWIVRHKITTILSYILGQFSYLLFLIMHYIHSNMTREWLNQSPKPDGNIIPAFTFYFLIPSLISNSWNIISNISLGR